MVQRGLLHFKKHPTVNHQKSPLKYYRSSRQRERLLELLRSTEIHPTASWLYDHLKEEFPNLSLGTIYRNLSILIDQCLIQKINAGSTFDRFEAKTTPHHHLICSKCGKIIDLEEKVMHEINEEIRNSTDFDIKGYRIEFFGTCRKCQEKR
ncbi:MAG: transcriptional repressor [Chlorobiaceae bacterium]|nr:transcriptional repressor [Chlorobiaceae bacterium]NTW10621.1 transcriptional repressor [Chlorobiaceae bacterium]